MISLIFYNSEVEVVPESMWHHPAIVNHAKLKGKKPQEILLDASRHKSAMKELDIPRKQAIAELTVYMCGHGTVEDFKDFINYLISEV